MNNTNLELAREAGGTAYTNRHVDGSAVAFGPGALDRYTALVEARLMAKLVKIVEEAVAECDAIKFSEHAEGYADGALRCLTDMENWGAK